MGPTDPNHAALTAAIRDAAGLAPPGASQFESLVLSERDGQLHFRYGFDFDGHSQYDKTVYVSGVATPAAGGGWQVSALALDHVGEAIAFALPKPPGRPGGGAAPHPSGRDTSPGG